MKTRISEMNALKQLHVEDYEPGVAQERIKSLTKTGFKQIDRNQTHYPMTFITWNPANHPDES